MKGLPKICFAAAVSVGAFAASTMGNAQSVGGAPLFAVLNGGNECNAAGVCRQGDLDAIGSATVTFVENAGVLTGLCAAIVVDNLAGATAAHIHSGVAGVNGGVVVTLLAPSGVGVGNPGNSSRCVNVAVATLNAIRADPTSFYVNVHNVAFPAGAIRGQLH